MENRADKWWAGEMGSGITGEKRIMGSPDQEGYLLFSWLHNNYEKHNRFCMRSYRFGNILRIMFCCSRKNVVSH